MHKKQRIVCIFLGFFIHVFIFYVNNHFTCMYHVYIYLYFLNV